MMLSDSKSYMYYSTYFLYGMLRKSGMDRHIEVELGLLLVASVLLSKRSEYLRNRLWYQCETWIVGSDEEMIFKTI